MTMQVAFKLQAARLPCPSLCPCGRRRSERLCQASMTWYRETTSVRVLPKVRARI
jgi:hypothetical protein